MALWFYSSISKNWAVTTTRVGSYSVCLLHNQRVFVVFKRQQVMESVAGNKNHRVMCRGNIFSLINNMFFLSNSLLLKRSESVWLEISLFPCFIFPFCLSAKGWKESSKIETGTSLTLRAFVFLPWYWWSACSRGLQTSVHDPDWHRLFLLSVKYAIYERERSRKSLLYQLQRVHN